MDAAPPYSGPSIAGTVAVDRNSAQGRLVPGFAGFSFEKTHMTDGFFTATNLPLIALFKLLGPGIVRIGANDVDDSTWVPTATPVAGGNTSTNVGTADVDALAGFLAATGWKAIYGVSMKTAVAPSVAESVYAAGKLGASLHSIEIGNEINFFTSLPPTTWESFETAIRAAVPGVPLAGPASGGGSESSYTIPFVNDEKSKLVLVTDHYYKGASSSNPTIANMLMLDPNVATYSKELAAAAQTDDIADGFRWGEMNSYSGHGAAGVSDVFASALWGIDFMLTTAEYGSTGVNFHGGGQNMDGNSCPNGVSSCTKPFRYSPIDEVNAQVTAAAPLYYGMLLVARCGAGTMFTTTATAGSLNFTAYAIGQSDGSTNVVLVNKDATNGVDAQVTLGSPVASASAVYLRAPSLASTSGVTLADDGVSPTGAWIPKAPYALTTTANGVAVTVPPASAALVHVE